MGKKNKCFSPNCNNQAETEFCPECLANGGFKPRKVNPQIENIFKYHAPKEGQSEKYEAINEKAKELAYLIDDLCPNSREKSLAITHLQETKMWANASIACN